MLRFTHVLSLFGFGAASGIGFLVIHSWPVAAGFSVILLLVCATLQAGREEEIKVTADRLARDQAWRASR